MEASEDYSSLHNARKIFNVINKDYLLIAVYFMKNLSSTDIESA